VGAFAVLGAALSFGCTTDPNDFRPSCDQPGDGSDLNGAWELRATGKRTGCSDSINGDVTIRNVDDVLVRACLIAGGALSVGERPRGENDAFVARIQNHDFSLLADEGYGSTESGFATITGGFVDGSCVSFSLTDPRDDGRVTYDFEGNIEDRGINGVFFGNGPEPGCRTSGTFSVIVTSSSGLPTCPVVEPMPPVDGDAGAN